MKAFWFVLLLASGILLLWTLLKKQLRLKWFGFAIVQLLIAAVIIYGINGLGWIDGLHVPINITTMFVIACLGLPGLILIVSLKLFVI